MIKLATKFMLPFVLVALGAVSTYVPWSIVSENVQVWYTEPEFTNFQVLYVSDAGTVYNKEEFADIKGNKILGTAICPKTGATKFQKIVGRIKTDFWGNCVGFELAETYQTKQRIVQAKGDMNWVQFFELAEESRNEEELTTVPDPEISSVGVNTSF